MVDNDDPIMIRQIINAAGYDTETGIYGVGYSPDNGKTFYVQNTSAGRKFRQQDADGLWPFLIDKIKSIMSIDWDSIQNKPKLVTQDELEHRLAKLSVPIIDWSEIQNKPDVATQEDLKNIELKPGPQGEPGTPGKDGVTPHIDSTTGDWFIGNQDTGTQAQGPAGKNGRDGVDGQPGKDGQNGITPHIDTATGNWFVGSTDTGIKAQGPQGIQGFPGKDGRNGIDGKDGDRGPQGLPGANGKDGSPGAPGSPGKDGKSTYQIWLDNGHSGTETDFLNSLKGAPGKDGKDAIDTVKAITSGTLSSLSTGKYEIDFTANDSPVSDWGMLDVSVGQHYAKQVFTVTGATGDNQGNVYVRVRDYSGQWHEWREITAWN